MPECGCVCADNYYEGEGASLGCKIVKARKEHVCVECHGVIQKGSEYERYKGVGGGGVHTSKTCVDCLSMCDVFFCGAYTIGYGWSTITSRIKDVDGEIASKHMLKLRPRALDKVIDIIDEYFDAS